MRLKDREISSSDELEGILRLGTVCRLGLCRDDVPYIVPMCYGYSDGCLYFHSAREGLKLEFIRSNRLVCFEIETDVSVKPAEEAFRWGMNYRSVIGYGNLEEVSGATDKLNAMNILMKHYSGSDNWSIPERRIENVLILKLRITEMTGKKSFK
ncbi:MAG: pyridoxamine 5'-phosphate oxidase family protein [Candidatus Aegiribacteria sp.]|nr:pyridoxamine 5'-phosphate oxidase family protein [Candidatus Aegiribacteria sp.]